MCPIRRADAALRQTARRLTDGLSDIGLAPAMSPGLFLIGCWSARRALIFAGPKHLSGFRIDQVRPCANRAGDGMVSLAFAVGRIVSDPALHVHARIRAAKEEGRHTEALFKI
jgi:hypothetical protein